MGDARANVPSLPSGEAKSSLLSTSFFPSFPAVLRNLVPGVLFGKAEPATPTQSYDEKMPSDLKDVIEKLDERKRELGSKLEVLKRHFETIENNYSTTTLQMLTNKAVADIERKKQSDVFAFRRCAEIKWNIAIKPKERKAEIKKAEDKKIEMPAYEPEIFSRVSLEVTTIDTEIKELNQYKELSESLDPAVILRAAVERYTKRCNILLKERLSLADIQKYVSEARIFNCVSDVEYNQNKFLYRHHSGSSLPKTTVSVFNAAIQCFVDVKASASLAYMCFNDEVTALPIYRKFYSVDMKRVSALEFTSDYVLAEKHLNSLRQRSLAIIRKYTSFHESKKNIYENYIDPMSVLQAAFRDLESEFKRDFSELQIKKFKKMEENIPVLQELDQLHVALQQYLAQLEKEMEESEAKCSTLYFFRGIIDKIKVVQCLLNGKVVIFQKKVQEKLPEFSRKYNGQGVTEKLTRLLADVVDKMLTFSDEPLRKAIALQSTARYAHASAVYEEKMAIMDVLQFIQDHVLSPDRLKTFWSHEVRSINLGCVFIGGARVRFADRSSAIVPHGIAALYEQLHAINFQHMDDERIVEAFKKAKRCIQQRINKNCGISLSRKDPTTQQFYNLFSRLPESNIITESVESFKENVSKIVNGNRAFLISEINYGNGDAVIRTQMERKA